MKVIPLSEAKAHLSEYVDEPAHLGIAHLPFEVNIPIRRFLHESTLLFRLVYLVNLVEVAKAAIIRSALAWERARASVVIISCNSL